LRLARRVALASTIINSTLALATIVAGWVSASTAVTAVGLEFLGDVLASSIVLVGLLLASRPPDANHPYGHGRLEMLAGLFVGVFLVVGGSVLAYHSLWSASEAHMPPGFIAIWALIAGIVIRVAMSLVKFRVGRSIGSASLIADASNDAVDILSAGAALTAVIIARSSPSYFLGADHYGGFAVGLVVVITGLRVILDASFDLADTMPDPARTEEVRRVAMAVPGVMGVEKQLARKTGLQYHVDLHVEVDPELTVRKSHDIAHNVRNRVREELAWVADVLVHVEPAPVRHQKSGT
jgi:cation diffusion facilitator family transporter